jgi:hypothetical protein
MFAPRLALLLLLASASPAFAEAPTAKAKELQTLESFGASNKTCAEWSDGCAVCQRRPDGSAACSLPGIACEPTSLACRPVPVDTAPMPAPSKPDAGTPPPPPK